jgi:hypothetical protein
MSGSHLCIPRNENVQPPYFQNITIMFSLSVPTLTYLRESYCIYFQDQSVYFAAAAAVYRPREKINRSQTHECGNWDWGHAIPRKGIHKWYFRCSVGYDWSSKRSRRVNATSGIIYFVTKKKVLTIFICGKPTNIQIKKYHLETDWNCIFFYHCSGASNIPIC